MHCYSDVLQHRYGHWFYYASQAPIFPLTVRCLCPPRHCRVGRCFKEKSPINAWPRQEEGELLSNTWMWRIPQNLHRTTCLDPQEIAFFPFFPPLFLVRFKAFSRLLRGFLMVREGCATISERFRVRFFRGFERVFNDFGVFLKNFNEFARDFEALLSRV